MRTLIATAVAALSAATAHAQTPSCYISANVGYTVADTEASVNIGPGVIAPGPVPGAVVVDGFSGSGSNIGLGGGCDFVTSGNFVLGAFADYTWHNADFEATSAIPGFAGTLLDLELENQWSIGGRAGFKPNPSTLVYALIAYTQLKTSDLGVPIAGLSFNVDKFTGIQWGGGIETEMMPNVVIGIEYRYSDLDSENISIIPAVATVDLEPQLHAVTATVKYRFGPAQ